MHCHNAAPPPSLETSPPSRWRETSIPRRSTMYVSWSRYVVRSQRRLKGLATPPGTPVDVGTTAHHRYKSPAASAAATAATAAATADQRHQRNLAVHEMYNVKDSSTLCMAQNIPVSIPHVQHNPGSRRRLAALQAQKERVKVHTGDGRFDSSTIGNKQIEVPALRGVADLFWACM